MMELSYNQKKKRKKKEKTIDCFLSLKSFQSQTRFEALCLNDVTIRLFLIVYYIIQ